MSLSPERIEEIRQRAEAATVGEWKYTERDNVVFTTNANYKHAVEIAEEITITSDGYFISAARQDIPDLLAEVERLQAILETLYIEGILSREDDAE